MIIFFSGKNQCRASDTPENNFYGCIECVGRKFIEHVIYSHTVDIEKNTYYIFLFFDLIKIFFIFKQVRCGSFCIINEKMY